MSKLLWVEGDLKLENLETATTSLSDLTALNFKKIQASLLADEGRALWSEILANATTCFLDLVWVILGAEL